MSSWLLVKPGCYFAIQTQHALHGSAALMNWVDLLNCNVSLVVGAALPTHKAVRVSFYKFDCTMSELKRKRKALHFRRLLMKYLWPLVNNCCSFFSCMPQASFRIKLTWFPTLFVLRYSAANQFFLSCVQFRFNVVWFKTIGTNSRLLNDRFCIMKTNKRGHH